MTLLKRGRVRVLMMQAEIVEKIAVQIALADIQGAPREDLRSLRRDYRIERENLRRRTEEYT